MIQVMPASEIEVLEERLTKGAELLFDMESRGEMGGEYDRWFKHYTSLLAQYESLQAA